MTALRWLFLILTVSLLSTARAQTVPEAPITFAVIDRPARTPDSRPLETTRWSLVRADAELRAPLDTALADAGLLATGYRLVTLYGRAALAVEAITADRTAWAAGVAGLLPDGRVVVAIAAPVPMPIDLAQFIDEVVYSNPDIPTARAHQPIWTADGLDAASWIGLALDAERVYGLHPRDGVQAIDAATGALVTAIPFDEPAQATGIAALDGVVYIGDRACRCIRRVQVSDGRWLDPIGRFAGGAPHAVSVIEGEIAAIDGETGAYLQRYFAVSADGTVREGTRTPIEGEALPSPMLNPDALVFAEPLTAGEMIRLAVESGSQVVAIGADGVLRLYDSALPPIRIGEHALQLGAPVMGTVSADRLLQTWTLPADSGDVCVYAVDPARTDSAALGLDMAIRLIGANGDEIGYNDDHADVGLFGVYDAAVCATLNGSADEVVTVQLEWVAGEGSYTLAVDAPRPLSEAIPVSGTISDAIPVQRWTFDGRAGDTVTVTMTALDGDLDPLLGLIAPDGTLVTSNDDAIDTTLGVNAQIVQARLPADGTYTLNAGRWSGSGAYALTLISTSPG